MRKTIANPLELPLPDWVSIDCLTDPFDLLGKYYTDQEEPMYVWIND
jgi:hypothetical protein